MKRLIVVALIFISTLGLLTANQAHLLAKPSVDAIQAMQMAHQFYEDGQFDRAAQTYQQLADQGLSDMTLFYNLGNAYFKQGDLGRAILNYRRAEALAPRDDDLRANLNLARSQTIDKLDKASGGAFFSHLAHLSQNWFTLNELATITLSLWFLVALLIIAFTNNKIKPLLKEGLQYALSVSSLFLVLGIFILGSRLYLEKTQPAGVIVATEVNVTSGPGSQYVTEFTLHSGTEISLLEKRGNWVRLALSDREMQGWAPANTVEAVAE